MEEMTGTNGHGTNDRNKGTQDLINVGGEESSSGESSGKEANLVF